MRRALALAAVAMLSACNVLIGLKEVEEGSPDSGITCDVASSYGLLSARDGATNVSLQRMADGTIWFAMALNLDSATDLVFLVLRPGMGGLPSPIEEGRTYTIVGDETKLESCGVCAFLGVNFSGSFDGDDFYFARSGQLTLTSAHGRLVAKLDNAVFRHVHIGATTDDVDDGCESTIQRVDVDLGFPAPDAGMPDAGPPDAPPPTPDAPVETPDAPVDTPDAPPPADAGVLVNVTGSAINTYFSDTIQMPAPLDLRTLNVEALVPDNMTYVVYPGTGKADGTFTIPVPETPAVRWLHIGSTYLLTGELTADFGNNFLGRPDITTVDQESAYFEVTVNNMETAKASDAFEVYSPNLNLFYAFSATENDTVLTLSFWSTSLIDMNRDRVGISQIATRMSSTGNTYFAASRLIILPAFSTMADHTTTVPTQTFGVIMPTINATLDWKRVAFQNLRTTVHPLAVFDKDALSISAVPRGNKVDLQTGIATDLFYVQRSDAVDVNFGTVSFGEYAALGWEKWGDHRSFFHVTYTAPGSSSSTDVTALVTKFDTLAMFNGKPIQPVVTPVRSLKLNNLDGYADRTGVGTTPLFSWLVPGSGVPSGYRLIINELYDDGGESNWDFVCSFYTQERQVRIPPGVLQAGHAYFVRVTAIVAPGWDPAHRPYRRGLPAAEADALSGMFTP